MRHAEYDCDRCGAETPDGHGYYYKGDRLCRECADSAEKEKEGAQ